MVSQFWLPALERHRGQPGWSGIPWFQGKFEMQYSSKTQLFGIALAAFLPAVVSGCGSSSQNPVPVAGVVTLNGSPVADLLVVYQPEQQGTPAIGYTDNQGRYELRLPGKRVGAFPGRYTVKINFDYDPGSDNPVPPFRIPDSYNSQSRLRAEVTQGPNQHDFELKFRPIATASAR